MIFYEEKSFTRFRYVVQEHWYDGIIGAATSLLVVAVVLFLWIHVLIMMASIFVGGSA